MQITVQPVSINRLDYYIKAHYLHCRPAVAPCCLEVRQEGQPIGCAVFALPPRETSKRYGGPTWELARLYLTDAAPKNSESAAIAAAVRWVKRNRPDVQHLVSYADPSANHIGLIYRASNWLRDGMTDDKRKTPRFDYVANGRVYSRRAHVPLGITPTRRPRVSKYRYHYPLCSPNWGQADNRERP